MTWPVAVLALASLAQAPSKPSLALLQSLRPPPDMRSHQLAALGTGSARQILFVTGDGRLHAYGAAGAQPGELVATKPLSVLSLKDPAYVLLDIARLLGEDGPAALVTLGPSGASAHFADANGTLAPEPQVLAARARFRLRVGAPRFAPFVEDINRDGFPDLVLPGGRASELWIHAGLPESPAGEPRAPSYRRASVLPVETTRWGSSDYEELSDVLESSFSIPHLATADVNGDGRPDLLVEDGPRRTFFLQRGDGGFPAEPDARVDLSIFRDGEQGTKVQPGRTLTVQEGATYETRDLDADGIPDYVIASGRKVWVFLGGKQGPQFREPVSVLKTAEDVTFLTLAQLDEDGRPDLLLVRVQVPTIATLIRGLVSEWDVEINAVGYRNVPAKAFETTPAFKSKAVVRLPSIVSLFKDPAAVFEPFEEIGERFGASQEGDLDGDGTGDLALHVKEKGELHVWMGRSGAEGGELDVDQLLRQVLFEENERVWDLERIALWFGSLAERTIAARTGGRAPDIVFPLRKATEADLTTLQAADLRGDGRQQLLLGYLLLPGRTPVFDILGWK